MKRRFVAAGIVALAPPLAWLCLSPWLVDVELLSQVATNSPSRQAILATLAVLCRIAYLVAAPAVVSWLLVDACWHRAWARSDNAIAN